MKWNPDTVLEFGAFVFISTALLVLVLMGHTVEALPPLIATLGSFAIRFLRGSLRPRYNDPHLPPPPNGNKREPPMPPPLPPPPGEHEP